jgi:hypothetical protein
MTLLTVERSAGPAYRTIPPRRSSAGSEAVELAREVGLFLDDWQAQVLEDSLAERDDGKWAALEVGLIIPRQNGKGSILEARELAGLFLFNESLLLHSAHEFATASEHFLRIWSLIEAKPDLERLVTKKLANNNGMLIQVGRQRLKFMARKTSQGRGFSGDCVVLDEAFDLSTRALSSMIPTLSARPNPQVWYTSSAPLPEDKSDVLRRFCRRGRAGDNRLCYLEWAADPDDDPASPATWAQANPALGIRRENGTELTEEFIAAEVGMLGEDFARERLGIWIDDDELSAVIPPESWRACESVSKLTGPEFFALDVSPDRTQASFAVAGKSTLGGTHVELADRRPGTQWVVARAKDLQAKWGGTIAVSAGSPAASLLLDLEAAGVEVEVVSNADHAQACGAFYDAVVQGGLWHVNQPELNAAVFGADRKFTNDAWLWSRRTSSADISPLVAATLAKRLFDTAPEPTMGQPGVVLL